MKYRRGSRGGLYCIKNGRKVYKTRKRRTRGKSRKKYKRKRTSYRFGDNKISQLGKVYGYFASNKDKNDKFKEYGIMESFDTDSGRCIVEVEDNEQIPKVIMGDDFRYYVINEKYPLGYFEGIKIYPNCINRPLDLMN